MWTRLVRSFTMPAPLANRLLVSAIESVSPDASDHLARLTASADPTHQPKMKSGRLLLEIGAPLEWRHVDVALAGSSVTDLGLYYYAHRGDASPLGCIRLHSAHVDVLEEVVMVVTSDKTWFLCAAHGRDASEWAEAICTAIDSVSVHGVLLHGAASQKRRLSNTVTAVTLREIQSREPRTRVDEFLEVFVRSSGEDIRAQAMKGAFSWSCMRNLAWKLWLDYLPPDIPFGAWQSTAREKRQRYEVRRKSHTIFARSLAGNESDQVQHRSNLW